MKYSDTIWQVDNKLVKIPKNIIDSKVKKSRNQIYNYSFNILNNYFLEFYFIYQKNNALFDIRNNKFYKLPDGGPNEGISDDLNFGPNVALWNGRYGIIIDSIPSSTILNLDLSKIRKESQLF